MQKLSILHTESSTGWGGQEIRILTEAAGMIAQLAAFGIASAAFGAPDELPALGVLCVSGATLAEGAQGALCDSVFEYGVRDALLYTIGGGTNEIQRTLIALRGLDLPR